jgi:hypothetical protein
VIEVSVLVDKLNSMQSSEIADLMKQAGVRGEVQVETACVLANWIRRESGKEVAVGVHRRDGEQMVFGVVNYEGDYDFFLGQQYEEFYPLEPGPQNFIGEFDNHRYPELIEDHEDYDV